MRALDVIALSRAEFDCVCSRGVGVQYEYSIPMLNLDTGEKLPIYLHFIH